MLGFPRFVPGNTARIQALRREATRWPKKVIEVRGSIHLLFVLAAPEPLKTSGVPHSPPVHPFPQNFTSNMVQVAAISDHGARAQGLGLRRALQLAHDSESCCKELELKGL